MVKDTILYDILGVEPTATDVELKKAYRKQAIKLHPDKNANDPDAARKFQELGEAYGILKEADKRAIYDELGKAGMEEKRVNNDAADIDPAEFFTMIFGGDSFKDWIGELSMLNDLSKAAEVLEEEDGAEGLKTESAAAESTNETSESLVTTVEKMDIKDDSAVSEHKLPTDTLTSEEIARKKKQKVSKEQREEMYRLHQESKAKEEERVNELVDKLLKKVEKYELAKDNSSALNQFGAQLAEEFEDLKIESFGHELLHLIGKIYKTQAHARLQSSKTFGVSKIFTNAKSTATTVKNGYSILKTALDAQASMEEMVAEQELLQQKETLTPADQARLAEMERLITGKFLATAWASTKFEVTGILNKVCNKVLNDKTLGKKERNLRAKALVFIGEAMLKVERSPEETEEARIFETMMAEASSKKQKKNKKPFDEKEFENYMARFASEKESEMKEADATQEK